MGWWIGRVDVLTRGGISASNNYWRSLRAARAAALKRRIEFECQRGGLFVGGNQIVYKGKLNTNHKTNNATVNIQGGGLRFSVIAVCVLNFRWGGAPPLVEFLRCEGREAVRPKRTSRVRRGGDSS